MKLVLTLIATILVTGCTSMKPIELSSDQLQNRISTGELIREGDTVRITTVEGKKQKFEVSAIDDGHVIGNGVRVPIVDITAIEIEERSDDKTAGLTMGALIAIMLAIFVAAMSPL